MTNSNTPRMTLTLLAGLGLLMVTLLTGCIPPSVTALVSGAAKIANGQASNLTSAEILALIGAANLAYPDLNLDVSSAQASAISGFLNDNNLNTQEDFANLIEGVTSGQTDLSIDEEIVALFVQDLEPESTEELSNQGGGSLTSGLTKVINSEISTLTPDEVQILGQSLGELGIGGEQQDQTLSDAQAAAIVLFIDINNINSVSDFENLDQNNVDIPEGADELFAGL